MNSPSFPILQTLLFGWFHTQARDLPWRQKARKENTQPKRLRDPYRVLVSELMLQQTQVARVIPKYEAFLSRWPSFEALSQASLADVVVAWQGLGYNRRAKYLLETAKLITHTYVGQFPTDPEQMSRLPGLGPYTRSAVQVFALGFQLPVIDTNVRRILQRVIIGLSPASETEISEIAEQIIPSGKADDWHQALMDFGALVCLGARPLCETCPVSRICVANKQAQAAGFATYALWLRSQPRKKQGAGKDLGKRFEETDRYFRGRIIDFLRAGEHSMEELWQYVTHTHHLKDRVRFARLIESLVVDGLLHVHGNRVSL